MVGAAPRYGAAAPTRHRSSGGDADLSGCLSGADSAHGQQEPCPEPVEGLAPTNPRLSVLHPHVEADCRRGGPVILLWWEGPAGDAGDAVAARLEGGASLFGHTVYKGGAAVVFGIDGAGELTMERREGDPEAADS